MKLRILSESMMGAFRNHAMQSPFNSPTDIVIALFEEVLDEPAFRGSYEVSESAGGHMVDVGIEGGTNGIFGAWKIYASSWFKWGLTMDEDATKVHDLPEDLIPHPNEYDIQEPGRAEAMQNAIRQYMLEFEKRNLLPND